MSSTVLEAGDTKTLQLKLLKVPFLITGQTVINRGIFLKKNAKIVSFLFF